MHDETAEGLFIGVGIDRYVSSDLADLTGSANEVKRIGELVGGHFDTRLLRDPDEATVQNALRGCAGRFADVAGSAIGMWSGHGIPGAGPGTLKLLAHDSGDDPSEGFDAVEFATRIAATGASQILVIIDTCYAGNAVDAILRIYNYFRVSPPAGEWCWFGLLAACGPEKVRQHQLGSQLERLLREGPRPDSPYTADIRRRWSTHHRFIRGDDLWDALIKQWDYAVADTEPKFASIGDARPFIRNPLWEMGAGPLSVVEVLNGTDARSVFFGRQNAISTIVSWLNGQSFGVYVIAGAQGSGKSALLHKALSTHIDECSSTDTSSSLIVDVSGLSSDVIAAKIDRILIARGLIDQAGLPRNALELCGALQRVRDATGRAPVIALDALSEATEPARTIETLIGPMGTVATVVVSTRPNSITVPRQRRASQPPKWAAAAETADLVSLPAVLAEPDRILDLDSTEHKKSGWDAIEEMFTSLLADDDPVEPIRALREEGGVDAPPPFVLADLLIEHAQQAIENQESTPVSVGNVLHTVLDRLVSHAYEDSTRGAAIALLNALPLGFGAGLPEREWLAIANATRLKQTPPLDRRDVAQTLEPFAAYIVEDSESDEAVYRFAHTLIAEYFAVRVRSTADDENTINLKVAAAMIEIIGSATMHESSPHLQRYLWRYIARAGELGLDLVRGHDSFTETLAVAALAVSIDKLGRRQLTDALSAAQEAVSAAERVTGNSRDQTLAPALAHLATVYQTVGQISRAVPVGRRAVATYNQLVSQTAEFVADLAAAAHNLANILMDAQDTTATEVAAQAVRLEQSFMREGGDNRYRLGVAHNTLALALKMEGRVNDAIQASRDAVEVLQAAVNITATERDRAALAQALQNLGSHLAERGEFDEAVTLTERARDMMDVLAIQDDTWKPALLETLSDLGVRYIQAGQTEQAVLTSVQAVQGYQNMTSMTASEATNYAGALTNYASILTAVGRSDAAMEPASTAVKILRTAADGEEAKRPALALMLDNYANSLTLTGHYTEAIEASEQALGYYRAAREQNPNLDNDVARVLSNHSQRLAAAGRFSEAIVRDAEAIALFEQLTVSDSRNAVYVATTRSVMAIHFVAAGNPSRGMQLAAQATAEGERLLERGLILEQQLATIYLEATKASQPDPAVSARYAQRTVQLLRQSGLTTSPEYATALRNLAACHGMAGQIDNGLEVISEAMDLWAQLLTIDNSHRSGLASALGTQAQLHLEHRRTCEARDTAIAAVEHYRLLPEMSRDDIETCGKALATLSNALVRGGEQFDALDEQIELCLHVFDGPTLALLIGCLVTSVPIDHPRIPSWIYTAIGELGTGNPMLLLHLRRIARRARNDNRLRFDQSWGRDTDTDVPGWIFIDERQIDWVMSWVSSNDFTSAERFLRNNDQLLGADYDSAVDEALLVVDPARGAALQDIRNRLRFARQGDALAADSVEGGHPHDGDDGDQQKNAYDTAEQFLEADLGQRLRLLAEHGELLRSETVSRHLRLRSDSQRANAAVSLIELSRIPLHAEIANVVRDAHLADEWLSRIAEQHDVKVLRQAGVVMMNAATEASQSGVLAVISFYLGVSLLQSELAEQMRELIQSAAEAAPDRVAAWQRLCQRLLPTKQEFSQAAELLEEEEVGDGSE